MNNLIELLADNNPIFINRIGGSDMDIMIKYIQNKINIDDKNIFNLYYNILSKWNGYFDNSGKHELIVSNLKKFLLGLDKIYKNNKNSTICFTPLEI